MKLPRYVTECLDALEEAGFAAYAVGGCVRDACLGLEPQDFDLCTAALPEQTEAVFSHCRLVLAGKKHGTVGVVTSGGVVEITTFRTEGDYRDSRHPDWVAFVTDIEKDLARRDFTVNAMAWSPRRGFADPFGGREDLKKGVLRAVGDPEQRFREDALRILRGARFAARYRLEPEENTENAMVSLVPSLDSLARERVFDELCKLLLHAGAGDLLRFAPILTRALPELAPMVGFCQHSPHHAYDLYTHTAHVTAAVPAVLSLRWAALLHDVGKVDCFTLDEKGVGHFYGHAGRSARMAEQILLGLKAPAALRRQTVTLIENHMTGLEPDRKLLRRRASRLGWEELELLLALQRSDMGSKGTGKAEDGSFAQVEELLRELRAEKPCLKVTDLAIGGKELMALGLSGPAIGNCLKELLEQVLQEKLPNEKQALLAAAERMPV